MLSAERYINVVCVCGKAMHVREYTHSECVIISRGAHGGSSGALHHQRLRSHDVRHELINIIIIPRAVGTKIMRDKLLRVASGLAAV
jgi:hypothetical protein